MFSIWLAYDFCGIRLWLACPYHMLPIHGTWEGHRKSPDFLPRPMLWSWRRTRRLLKVEGRENHGKTTGKPWENPSHLSWLIIGLSWFIIAYHGLSWFIRAYLGLSLWDIVSEIYCEILWMGVCSSFSHTHVFPSSSKLVSSAKVSVHSLTDLTAGLWTTLDHFFLNQRYSRCSDDYRHKYKQRSSLQNSPNINATALKTLV